jgi:predicted permease
MSQRHLSSVSLLEQCMFAASALALVAMLSLPAMRSVSESFGWVPFWLLVLPLTGWAVARALRQRGPYKKVLPMATVHPMTAVRSHATAVGPQTLRRAA